jgi:iron complex transport system substrate-binding protein
VNPTPAARPRSRLGLRAVAVAGLAVGGLALGCAPSDTEPARSASSAGPPRRLGVLAPAAAETLALIGAGNLVVGVGDWVGWPPELAARPKLGAYDAPSEERLLELGVDALVTTAGAAGRREREEIARLGIRVIELDTATLDGTLASIAELGRLVGREAAARALVESIRARLAAVARRAEGAPRRRVLVAVGRDPLYVAGPGSHFDELVRIAGGENVAADLGAPYALGSEEALRARNPEVIVDSSDNRPGALRGALLGSWASWTSVRAVAEARVYHLDPARLSIPGPRLGEMAELLGKLIHPELFGTPAAAEFGPLGRLETKLEPALETASEPAGGAAERAR